MQFENKLYLCVNWSITKLDFWPSLKLLSPFRGLSKSVVVACWSLQKRQIKTMFTVQFKLGCIMLITIKNSWTYLSWLQYNELEILYRCMKMYLFLSNNANISTNGLSQTLTCCIEGMTGGVACSGAKVSLPVEPTVLEFSPSLSPAVPSAEADIFVSPPSSPDQTVALFQFD